MKPVALLAALSLVAAASVHAQMYKWKDASGRMQYGDRPPAGASATPVAHAAGAAGTAAGGAAQPAAPKSTAEQEQEFRKRQIERQEQAREHEKLAAQTKEREENCRRAKAHLASLESGIRQARLNDQGERFYLDDAAIDREKVDARRIVAQHCN